MRTPPETSRPSARYLVVFFVLVGLGMALMAAFNYFADPFGAYRPRATAGLEKFRAYEFRRLYVGELLRHEPPEVLLLGSSRTFVGVDPRWPEWGGAAVNTGIPSATMEEIDAIARNALEGGRVRRVYLFADFFAFNDSLHTHRDFPRSRFSPRFNAVAYHLRNLITIDSLDQSLEVVRAWRQNRELAPWVSGFKVRHQPPRRPDLRGEILWSMNFYLKSPTAFSTFRAYTESLEHLRMLVRRCRAKGVELTVVVLPVHALHLEVMRGAGMWELFEAWERDVASMLEDEAREAGGAPYPFWDFSACRGAAAEAIPQDSGPAPSMKYFRDEAHPLPALVRLVAQRITGKNVKDPLDKGRFGALVTSANVEEHLALLVDEREAYAASHPLEAEWVANLSAAAAKWNAAHRIESPK